MIVARESGPFSTGLIREAHTVAMWKATSHACRGERIAQTVTEDGYCRTTARTVQAGAVPFGRVIDERSERPREIIEGWRIVEWESEGIAARLVAAADHIAPEPATPPAALRLNGAVGAACA